MCAMDVRICETVGRMELKRFMVRFPTKNLGQLLIPPFLSA